MSEIKPFLSFAARPSRAFADAIDSVDVPVQPSPWSPKTNGVAPTSAAPSVDVDTLRADAIARGREEGLAETAALRARLGSLVEKLAAAHAAKTDKMAELVADAACSVVGAWSQVDRAAMFTAIIRAWTETSLGAASARVNPIDAELVGDKLPLVTDPAVKPGDIVIRNASAELTHVWEDRLRELRETIVASLEETK